MASKIKILFLAANPSNTMRLSLDREVKQIAHRLRDSRQGDRFEVIQEWAVQVSDLQEVLLRHEPQFVHFSGHGRNTVAVSTPYVTTGASREMLPVESSDSQGEILVENEHGQPTPIAAPALARLFGLVGGVRCVLLNACYSATQADAIAEHVEVVIGMRRSICDEAAILFSWSYYQALGYDKPIVRAFDLAVNQLELHGYADHDVPQLLHRKRVAHVSSIPPAEGDESEAFFQRVERIARLRNPSSTIRQKDVQAPLAGLLEIETHRDGFSRLHIVGALNSPLTEKTAQAFRKIDGIWRQREPALRSTLVHAGPIAPVELRASFAHIGIEIRTFDSYQGIFDLQPYVEWQKHELDKNHSYSTQFYVDQPGWVKMAGTHERMSTENALQTMLDLLNATEHRRFLLVLGEFGAGKTFLLRELCRHLVTTNHTLVPVLLEMSKLEKQHSLTELLGAHFARAGIPGYDFKAFNFLLGEGRIALLFDGFDELADKVTFESATQHLETVLAAVHGQAKVVLSSRRQHFLTDGSIHKAVEREFARRAETAVHGGYRLIMLEPFGELQIRRYLRNVLKDEAAAEARYMLLDEVKDLIGLSHNPRMLSFIAEIPEVSLREAKRQWGEITAAKLYELLVKQWLDFEYDRSKYQGTSRRMSRTALLRGVEALALFMWQNRLKGVDTRQIHEGIAQTLETLDEGHADPEAVTHRFGSASLLQRDGDGLFSFVHQSVMEWLVAKQAAAEVLRGEAARCLMSNEMSILMADFFAAMTGRALVVAWARKKLVDAGEPILRKNAMLVLTRLGERLEEVNFEGEDLRGRDFSGADWRGANLCWADLRGATLKGCDLRGASLIGANLAHADLREAKLTRAETAEADFAFVQAKGADFSHVVSFDPMRFRGANLLNAKGIPAEYEQQLIAVGAAPMTIGRVDPMHAAHSACRTMAWSPTGTVLALGHTDGRIRLLDGFSGRVLRVLSGHLGAIRWLAFSPNDQILASCSDDKMIRLWQVGTGRKIPHIIGHDAAVHCIAFSPNGEVLASGTDDRLVRLWNVATGRRMRISEQYTGPISALAFSPNGATLAIGTNHGQVDLWNITDNHTRTFSLGNQAVQSIAFSVSGKQCAAFSTAAPARVIDLGSDQIRNIADIDGIPFRVSFSPGGVPNGIGQAEEGSPQWQLATNRSLHALLADAQQIYEAAFDEEPMDMVPRFRKGSSTSASRRSLRDYEGRPASITGVAFSPDGQTIASSSDDKLARLWKLSGHSTPRALAGHARGLRRIAFFPDGETLATASLDKTIRLWNVRTEETFCVLEGHTDAVHSIAVSPDGQTLVSGSQDKTVRAWDITGGVDRVFRGHTMLVHDVAFSPDNRIVASASHDKTVRLWEFSTGATNGILKAHASAVTCVIFSPDGRMLATGSTEGSGALWDIATKKSIHTFEGHLGAIRCMAISPNGRWIATGSSDMTVRLWSVARGHTLSTFEGHSAPVLSVSFSPNGKIIATGSADNTVRLWDAETSQCLIVLLAAPEGWVAFTPDGHYKFGGNIAGSFWHMVGLCRFEPGEVDELLHLRIPDGTPLVTV